MDEKSLQYIDLVRQRLTAFADTNRAESTAFIAAELKRFGLKPKSAQGRVYCDIGRSKTRTAFYAEIDPYQTSVMLCLAAELAANQTAGVRLIFDGNTDDEHDLSIGVSELYSVALNGALPSEGIGCCYGVACAGSLEFSLAVIGGEWTDVRSAVGQIAERYAISCNAGEDGRFYMRYFDSAKCESALLDVERLAQCYDDEHGTEHVLTVTKNYPPLKNDALCVDKVRQAAGERVTLLPSAECSLGVSRYLDKICGCTVFGGEKAQSTLVRLFSELAEQ